jgi:lysophospholipase L1-like esterase
MRQSRFCFLSVSLVLLFSPGKSASVAPVVEFRANDRWTVIGDSITQYGSYYAWVYLYYATRFPDCNLSVTNAAISGDSAAGTVKRYDWDIKPTRATVATVMLGMNDVSRDLYLPGTASPETLTRRQAALANYRQNLEHLVQRLRQDGTRVILITPSPFDETVDVDFPRLPGVNQALAECATFMRALAEKGNGAVIDLHGSMTRLNDRLQAKDPKFTLIGSDRVHPGIPGHLVMAYFILRTQQAPATVARITVDVGMRQATAENASVDQLAVHEGKIEFRCIERALPYPFPAAAGPALEWVPFQEELNQEILQVSGLKPGRYELAIDDERVGEFSANRLAAGLNLADFPATPQLRQAREVLKLVDDWQSLVANGQRAIAEVEHWRLPQVPHPVDLDEIRPRLEAELARLKNDPSDHANLDRSNIERYFKIKPQEPAILDRLNDLQSRIRATAQPQSHVFRLIPLSASQSESASAPITQLGNNRP